MDTTTALLKQALEALEECRNALSNGFDERTGQPVFKSVAAMLAHISTYNAASALAAFDSLSEYDKAIHALAVYLGEGEYVYWSGVLRRWNQDRTYLTVISSLEIPPPPEGDDGARCITHNSDGTVTVERG